VRWIAPSPQGDTLVAVLALALAPDRVIST
jgi:hypothetical protein